MSKGRIGQEMLFMECSEGDSTITMLDGSLWTIPSGEITKVICWTPTSRILVKECQGGSLPYKLINLDSDGPQWVEADCLY